MTSNSGPDSGSKRVEAIFNEPKTALLFFRKIWTYSYFMDYLDYLLRQGGNSKLKANPLHIEEMTSQGEESSRVCRNAPWGVRLASGGLFW